MRLCDVDRTGRSLNVCDGNVRIEPAQLTAQADGSLYITVAMSATAYRFRAGHQHPAAGGLRRASPLCAQPGD